MIKKEQNLTKKVVKKREEESQKTEKLTSKESREKIYKNEKTKNTD